MELLHIQRPRKQNRKGPLEVWGKTVGKKGCREKEGHEPSRLCDHDSRRRRSTSRVNLGANPIFAACSEISFNDTEKITHFQGGFLRITCFSFCNICLYDFTTISHILQKETKKERRKSWIHIRYNALELV